MPSRTALLELATRRNSYVCRSCLTALGLSHPPLSLTRGYARNSRTGKHHSLNSAEAGTAIPSPSPSAKARSNAPEYGSNHFARPGGPHAPKTDPYLTELDLEADTTPDVFPNEKPKINYFEKDPETGEVTPVPEDDGEPEPDFEDIAELGRNILGKTKMLDVALGKSDMLDRYLERLLRKHGPPGAIEAFRAALRSYDEPAKSQPQSDFNLEKDSDSDVKAEDVMGSFMQAISDTNYDDTPELKDAVGALQVALKSVADTSKDEISVEKATNNTSHKAAKLDPLDVDRRERNRFPLIAFAPEKYSVRGLTIMNRRAKQLDRRMRASLAAMEENDSDANRRLRDNATNESVKQMIRELSSASRAKVPNEVWQALWTIFSYEGPHNNYRSKRLARLSSAMLKTGAHMSDEQQMLAMEAMFEQDAKEAALDWWKREVTYLGHQDNRVGVLYWQLGVRLWCAAGDLERAERACKSLLQRSTPSNPADSRVLLHLIQAYCEKPETAERGFTFYRSMRNAAIKMEHPLEIQDYDEVIALFLLTGHTDYAMFTFTDMMFDGTIDLYGKSKLPSPVRNQFFFGKWLKRLIGAGDLEGAYKVLVFMQKNGVVAASVQVNGLLGAWLRAGSVSDRERADSLGWAMIRSRQAFVDVRKREDYLNWPVRFWDKRVDTSTRPDNDNVDDDNGDAMKLDPVMVPRATVETFIILASQYRERNLFTRLEELFVAYKQCEMPNDAMMMNELIAAAVAQNHSDKARELYTLMVHEHDVLPSTDTFAILFSGLPINLARVPLVSSHLKAESTRQARAIFADMMSSAWVYRDKVGWRGPKHALSENQAKLILHSFRKAGDWPGLSAALMGLRDMMEYKLTRGVMLEMIEGVENIGKPSARMGKMVIRATLKLQNLVEDMQKRGELDAHLTSEGLKDWKVLYNILLSFFFRELQLVAGEDTERLIEEAKEEMGLSGMEAMFPQRQVAGPRWTLPWSSK